MPHTASAEKRLRKNEKRRKHNRSIMKKLKLTRRETVEVIKGGDAAKISEQVKILTSKLDRAAAKGYIHKNKAARLKSRLAKNLSAAKA